MSRYYVFALGVVLSLGMCLGAWGDVPIDEEHFPDEAFRAVISEKDKDGYGILSDEEIANVNSISVSEEGIASLKGIEYFTAIEYLFCGNNELTELDLSHNTALIYLSCHDNHITSIKGIEYLTALRTVGCFNNELTELDLTHNTALTYLMCSNNPIAALRGIEHLTAL